MSQIDEGYFPLRSSMLRRVQEERVVGLFFGQRALCIGALAPLNYVGTSEHTAGKLQPFRRLVSTAHSFETIFFGSRAEADRVLARVHRLHERVAGELPEDAGPFPAGTPYSAYDPEEMLWTVAVAAESALHFYELFVRRLDAAARDAFWDDYVRFGELFGMPRAVAPATWREFREWWEAKLAGDEMFLTDEARYVGHATAFEIPLPWHSQAQKRMHDLIMLGSLPPRVRELYGLDWTPAQAAARRMAVAAIRAGRAAAPRAVTHGYNTRFFDLVAETEQRRIERGKPTPQVPAAAWPGGAVTKRPPSSYGLQR
jgi:uncharacterized protein (DUF2236 family)